MRRSSRPPEDDNDNGYGAAGGVLMLLFTFSNAVLTEYPRLNATITISAAIAATMSPYGGLSRAHSDCEALVGTRIVIYCHYLPVSGLGNLRACCLP